MGYFMTPIISIVLGYFFLNEKIVKIKININIYDDFFNNFSYN